MVWDDDDWAGVDTDGDGIVNAVDNCLDDANADQANYDGDAQGDACDSDDDNDGYSDTIDAFPFDDTEWLDTDGDWVGNNGDTDDDGDALLDVNDNCPLVANPGQEDDNANGVGDACEVKVYTVSPCRIVDTREADPALSEFSGDRLEAGETVPFFVTEDWIAGQGGAADCGIPDHATGVFINVVAVLPAVAKAGTSSGYLTLYPYGEDRPTASTINYRSDTTAVANGLMASICDPVGTVCDYDLNVYNHVNLDVHLVIDVTGYMAVPQAGP